MSTILRIDSRDRESASASNTNFVVNHVPIHTAQARIKMVIIPNMFNNIRTSPTSDANSIFSYEVGGVPASFIIPSGFYNITQLIDYIESQFDTGSLTLTFSETTGLITFTNNTLPDFKIINKADGNQIADVLGIVTTQTVAATASITFTNKPNLFSYQMLYIASRRLSNGYNLISADRRLPIVATIPLNEAYGGIVHYEVQQQHPIVFQSDTNLEDIDIQLVNHAGEVVELPSNHHIQILVESDNTVVK